MIDKLQKWICKTVGQTLAASLEILDHRSNGAILSLFYKYYFGRCSFELAELVSLSFSCWRYNHYTDILRGFSYTAPRCYKDAYVNSFFPHIFRLWNSLTGEYFSLTYDLNNFKFRINRHVLSLGS